LILEHSFVSTMPCDELMTAAQDFLGVRGFLPEPLENDPTPRLQVRRGRLKAGRTRSILELPQCIRLDWDRGRVNLALSITPNVQSTGGFALSGASTVSSKSKKLRLHAALMTAIANSLELLLADRLPPAQAAVEWLQVEDEIVKKTARDAKLRVWKILLIMVLVIVLPIAVCIILLSVLPKH
jgi:hypothetical protein